MYVGVGGVHNPLTYEYIIMNDLYLNSLSDTLYIYQSLFIWNVIFNMKTLTYCAPSNFSVIILLVTVTTMPTFVVTSFSPKAGKQRAQSMDFGNRLYAITILALFLTNCGTSGKLFYLSGI